MYIVCLGSPFVLATCSQINVTPNRTTHPNASTFKICKHVENITREQTLNQEHPDHDLAGATGSAAVADKVIKHRPRRRQLRERITDEDIP